MLLICHVIFRHLKRTPDVLPATLAGDIHSFYYGCLPKRRSILKSITDFLTNAEVHIPKRIETDGL